MEQRVNGKLTFGNGAWDTSAESPIANKPTALIPPMPNSYHTLCQPSQSPPAFSGSQQPKVATLPCTEPSSFLGIQVIGYMAILLVVILGPLVALGVVGFELSAQHIEKDVEFPKKDEMYTAGTECATAAGHRVGDLKSVVRDGDNFSRK